MSLLLLGVTGSEYSTPATPSYLLLEIGDNILAENNDLFIQE